MIIGESLPGKEKIWEIIEASILPSAERQRPASKQLEPLIKPIREMIQDSKEPIKPKSAFKVQKATHNIDVSYETFKNFVRKREPSKKSLKHMICIELPPWLETQIDYGKVGLLEDPSMGKRMVIWAFCGLLSHSLLPFIQFVYTQVQRSFKK